MFTRPRRYTKKIIIYGEVLVGWGLSSYLFFGLIVAMAGTMVAFNPRGDHFIPLPVPLGRWGSAPPDFSSLLSLHHCKEEVGLGGWEMCGSRAWLVVSLWLSFLFATQRESFPSPERVVSGRQGIGSSEMLPADSKAESLGRGVGGCRSYGNCGDASLLDFQRRKSKVWIKGVACRFSFVAFLLPSQKKSSRVQSGSL